MHTVKRNFTRTLNNFQSVTSYGPFQFILLIQTGVSGPVYVPIAFALLCANHISSTAYEALWTGAQLTRRRELPGNSIACCSLPATERCKIASRNNRSCSGQWKRGDKWGMGCYAEHVRSRGWKSSLHHLICNFWPQWITISQSNLIALKVSGEIFISLTFIVWLFLKKFSFHFNNKGTRTWRLCIKSSHWLFIKYLNLNRLHFIRNASNITKSLFTSYFQSTFENRHGILRQDCFWGVPKLKTSIRKTLY